MVNLAGMLAVVAVLDLVVRPLVLGPAPVEPGDAADRDRK
ncbi:hypothetical protein FTUN_0082 [Frigoriglobus tundricola]|uniref:Uncharacterized protein n=1 Tax=Frigoriglobus tundricola TaxID=2774151 RepID=A0A6M5YEZ4_9BACT|nr:hypothetical protein FTUN_0082 [Frigoriglobus tundricola]